jgi:uncharacterized protein YdaU (DUF1376 family)
MAEFPALPLWTDAYLGDTKHLTTIQHGAFLLLLIVMWRSKECRVPDDNLFLARVVGLTPAQWARMRPILEPLNEVQNGWWSNKRLRDELNAVKRQRNQKKLAGRASALKRLNRGSTFVEQPSNGRSTPTPTPTEEEETVPSGTVSSSSTRAHARASVTRSGPGGPAGTSRAPPRPRFGGWEEARAQALLKAKMIAEGTWYGKPKNEQPEIR